MKPMQPVQAIQPVHRFPGLSTELLALLHSLAQADWQRPTACAGWSVKDVCAHLLGGNLGRLASRREQFPCPGGADAALNTIYALWEQLPGADGPFEGFDGLLAWINLRNAQWVQAARQLSEEELKLALQATDQQLYEFFSSLPASSIAGPAVFWAGESQSYNWFDIAREYTEKWLHQQHIREALGQPVLHGREWLHPVLDTFLRALPHAYRFHSAPPGTAVVLSISGAAGGEWTLLRQDDAWALYSGQTSAPAARIRLSDDLTWRLFTKGIQPEEARPAVEVAGDAALGEEILRVVAIMA